jgi:hypothetical protein
MVAATVISVDYKPPGEYNVVPGNDTDIIPQPAHLPSTLVTSSSSALRLQAMEESPDSSDSDNDFCLPPGPKPLLDSGLDD